MPALNALPWWLRQILMGLGLFLAGGVIAFGYSYRPLHGAKNWKIEHLESRLDEVNRENLALSDELAGLRSVEATKVDPETLAQVERELGKTRQALTPGGEGPRTGREETQGSRVGRLALAEALRRAAR